MSVMTLIRDPPPYFYFNRSKILKVFLKGLSSQLLAKVGGSLSAPSLIEIETITIDLRTRTLDFRMARVPINLCGIDF